MTDPKRGPALGELYVVATPIGNRADITVRALRVLAQAQLVAAEDTRKTGRLLAHYHLKRPMISYHEHNEAQRTPQIIEKLKGGATVVLVTSAGTPTVSDPGHRLVVAAIENGISVIPLPGASAIIAALSVSGLATHSFTFVGFMPKTKARRTSRLQKFKHIPGTLVFYESPQRILSLIEDLLSVFGNRHSVIAREMTKLHEEFMRSPLAELAAMLRARKEIKGECVLLVAGAEDTKNASWEDIKQEIAGLLRTSNGGAAEMAREIAARHGVSKNRVYREILLLKKKTQ